MQAAVEFYTGHLGFTLRTSAAPAFADVVHRAVPTRRAARLHTRHLTLG
ncbi:hypothetical protein [Nocardia sp. NPDC057440]